MTSKRIAQTNQQQKNEKPQESGILQRAAVRPVSDAGMQSTDDKEALTLSNSVFSKDFSRVPISTTKPQQFQPRNSQSHLMPPIQAKLTIGEPGDRYEQEADRVASEVVQRINAPALAGRSVQHQEIAEKDIQAKPEITSLQRRSKPEGEFQAKLTLQRREAIAGGEASTDLESTINLARGGGQPLDAGLQQSMGQTMGADFSGVRVHTDAQSDQLNQSIQAKAFTTGQDVFFRQGAYQPGSWGGQALIAHELTHVVQQNGGAVQRSLLPPQSLPHSGTPVVPTIIQKATINPNTFFPGARADNDVDADINANNMSGFGTTVNGGKWHTQLTFDPLVTPGPMGTNVMKPEGSGVIGVIGPDHPYGSQPYSQTAADNNQIAGDIRGMNPHAHVAAHIVNDQLGGPGIEQNLFALPGNANTLMETQVESKMKTAVTAGNYIYYRAVVHHPPTGPADYITMSWNKLDHDGNDIGGGQANVRINANNTAANTAAIAPTAGVEAKNQNLINPTNGTVIKFTPWGPFQMPDPKQIIGLGIYLDCSEFPAVGNAKAFEEFLKNQKNNTIRLDMMFLALPNDAILSNIGRWISDKSKSNIEIKRGRGVTKTMVDNLKTGGTLHKQHAFISILDTGDANKMIPMAAKQLAKEARSTARAKV